MLQGVQLFLKNVVLAPNADVRSFYDSDQTFVDTKLAPLYGVRRPRPVFARFSSRQAADALASWAKPPSSRHNPKPTARLRRDEGSSSWRASSA